MNGDIIDCLIVTFVMLSGWIAAAICNVKWASFLDETTDKWAELCISTSDRWRGICERLFMDLQKARRGNDGQE